MNFNYVLRRLLCGSAVLALSVAGGGMAATPANAQGIDVVFKIDESGSMYDDIVAVQSNVVTIFSALPAGSHVGLVGYGTHLHPPANYDQIPHVHTPLTSSPTAFSTAVGQMVANGNLEEGYRVIYESAMDAIQVDWQGNANPSLNFRGAPYCNILITDEPPDQQYTSGSRTMNEAIWAMQNFYGGQGGIFFGILPNSYFSQAQPIADATGGQLFDLVAFRTNPQPVIQAVLEACVEAAIPVELDIKPGSCPNPFQTGQRGVTPAAFLGSDLFDVNSLVPDTIQLEGCDVIRWGYEDVSTPFDGDFGDPPDMYACCTAGPDGYMDLSLKFDSRCLTNALAGNDGVMLWTATGKYLDEYGNEVEFEAQDVVWVR